MKPRKITADVLRLLNPEALSNIQNEYVSLRLAGKSCQEIADSHGVCLQYVYKVLWGAVATKDAPNEHAEYTQLSKPQQQCVYKNFALEIRRKNLKLFHIADEVGIPSSKLSYYLYNTNKLPLNVALRIQQRFFPELTMDYLFARSLTPKCSDYEFDCVYPNLIAAMEKRRLLAADLADALDMSEEKMLGHLREGSLTYEDAVNLNIMFFEGVPLTELFEESNSIDGEDGRN